MPNPAVDLTGCQFGYLTVLRRAGTTNGVTRRATWEVQCICGKVFTAIGGNLRGKTRGTKKSCGCRRREMLLDSWKTHGMTGHPAWIAWSNMRSRCSKTHDKDWRNYGARGITVCERWQSSFENFWVDMGPTYQKGLTLGRINNDGPYEPSNCAWVNRQDQANNTRRSVHIETPAGRMTVSQAAERYGVKRVTLAQRLRLGWTIERALIPPGSTTL